jgi:hypothetical protein
MNKPYFILRLITSIFSGANFRNAPFQMWRIKRLNDSNGVLLNKQNLTLVLLLVFLQCSKQ